VELDAAFRRSFCGPPGLRPSAAEWALLLRQLHRQLVPCNRSPRHHHPRGRACLWCAVEQQLGQPLCRFSPPTRQPRISESPAAPPLQPASAAALLREQLEDAQQQAGDLLALRAGLAEQLLQLEPRLLALQQSNGSPAAWLDADALQRRLGSLRHRLSRWLGRHSRTAQREAAVAGLMELASAAAAAVRRTSRELEQQRLDLLQQLASADGSAVADGLLLQSEPAEAVAAALERATEQQRERWLLEQLAQHTIRSWRVEGFGEGRLALLERHGLVRADQLHQHIERITALPGIGKGLQNSLRQRLAAVVRQLQQHQPPAAVALADLRQQIAAVPLPVMPLQEGLERLLEQVQTLHGGADRLEQRLEHHRCQRDQQLQQLENLF
jgi:DNA-binding helix-hairpin-helix protein with protein kinase domain